MIASPTLPSRFGSMLARFQGREWPPPGSPPSSPGTGLRTASTSRSGRIARTLTTGGGGGLVGTASAGHSIRTRRRARPRRSAGQRFEPSPSLIQTPSARSAWGFQGAAIVIARPHGREGGSGWRTVCPARAVWDCRRAGVGGKIAGRGAGPWTQDGCKPVRRWEWPRGSTVRLELADGGGEWPSGGVLLATLAACPADRHGRVHAPPAEEDRARHRPEPPDPGRRRPRRWPARDRRRTPDRRPLGSMPWLAQGGPFRPGLLQRTPLHAEPSVLHHRVGCRMPWG